MELKQQIQQDLKDAMRSGDQGALQALRLLSASMTNREKESGELTDADVQKLVSAEIKKRKEAAVAYEKGGRDDLAKKELEDVEIFQRYLPEQMSDEELRVIIEESVSSLEVSGPGDMGDVMSVVMPKVQGRAEGARVRDAVQQYLQTIS